MQLKVVATRIGHIKKMKTIFLTSFNPFIARNILATDVLRILKECSDLKIVVFVPDYKIDWFKKNFSGLNVVFEGIMSQKISRTDVIFTYLASSLLDSKTLAIHKREELAKDHNYFKFAASWALRKIIGRAKTFRWLVRLLDSKFSFRLELKKYFDSYKPDLLFATDVYHNDDVHFLLEAQRRCVSTIGMIRSWDNITNKGIFRAKPDQLIVHNETIRDEAVQFNDFNSEKIFVSGIPQYDDFVKGQRMERAEFFAKLGLDPAKKLIMYSPFGGRFYKYDGEILEILKELGEQVLVRMPPNDKTELIGFQPTKLFYIDQSGHKFQKDTLRDVELNQQDMRWLGDSLYHTDVLVACGASIAIDAALFNKPSVFIYFDGLEEDLPYMKSARRWLDFDHARKLRDLGGSVSAMSKKELLEFVGSFLRNPAKDQEKRRALAEKQCWKLDGRSGHRIAEFILARIDLQRFGG
ncbi:MAG: CDP-glycerol glycerophosphotransferase family protein [bacterium]|nr:CDP-glycerol glycerophosphotransferase family protein [bacterium]